jgi:3-oxoacyl-[acyl-carrier protein] reductase
MLLENKTAVVYGAAGAIGSAVARAYARQGASVHLAGRTIESLDGVAETIRDAGGTAHVNQVDVLDRAAVEHHTASILDTDGRIDVCFNATSNDDIQGRTLLDMRFEEFMRPVKKSLTAHFNIATTVAPLMARGDGGVILVMAGGREAIPRFGPTAEPADEHQSPAAPGTEALLLHHQPTYGEVANIAAFLASDSARTMTATEINLTGGAVID